MTTRVTVEVPAGADYVAKVIVTEGFTTTPCMVISGETFITHVWGDRRVVVTEEKA